MQWQSGERVIASARQAEAMTAGVLFDRTGQPMPAVGNANYSPFGDEKEAR